MILLVTPSHRAAECAAALHEATGEEVVMLDSLARATTFLRTGDFVAVVLDQHLLETEPHEAGIMLGHVGSAIPVQVNLAVSGAERLVREVRAAMLLRQREEASAREAALAKLYGELNGTLTALLLTSELATKSPGLTPAAVERMEEVRELVKKLRHQLESAETGTAGAGQERAGAAAGS